MTARRGINRIYAALTLFLLVLGFQYIFLPEAKASTSLSDCATLSVINETFTLTSDIGTGGDCIYIAADNITIDGNGFTINGNISGISTDSNFTLINTNIVGNVYLVGADTVGTDDGSPGGNGTDVTLIDSMVSGEVKTNGGSPAKGAVGSNGSNCDCDDGDGGAGSDGGQGGRGGDAGNLYMYGASSVGIFTGIGRNGGDGGDGGSGGSPGWNSGSSGAPGVQGVGGGGGNGGSIYRRSLSTVTSSTLTGGSGGGGSINGTAGITGSEYVDLPSVGITNPLTGTLSGPAVSFTATSSDFVGPSIIGVQFSVDSTNLGSEDTTFPYGTTIDTSDFSDGSHTLYAVVRNSAGVYATSSAVFSFNSSAPVISLIATSTLDTSATVTWSTNISSDSRIWYGTTPGIYTNTVYDSNSTTTHSLGLTNLVQSTTHYFIIVSVNEFGLVSTSTEKTFTTIAPWTEQTGAGSRSWNAITSSADGTKLAATAANGYIYTSTNSGVTWTEQTGAGSRFWGAITSSADGTKLAAAAATGYIYTSTNSGVTWTEQTNSGSRAWRTITSSDDGTKLAAAGINTYIYTSTNSGSSWTEQTNSGVRNWRGLTSSFDGTNLAAGVVGSYVFTSSDSGATWNQRTNSGSRSWTSVASSDDGTKLAAAAAGSYIFTSTNNGANWTPRTLAGIRSWLSVSSSDDGTKLAAVASSGYVYTSTDSGATWTTQINSGSRSWAWITSSGSAVKLAAVATSGYIYTSSSDTSGPIISSISSGTPTASTATISWSLSEAASSTISYGTDENYGNITATTSLTSINLSSLTSCTSYHFLITAQDAAGNISTSTDQIFTTSDCSSGGQGTIFVNTAAETATNDAWWADYAKRNGLLVSTSTASTTESVATSTPVVVVTTSCRPGDLFNINTGARCSSTPSPLPTPTFTKDLSFNMTDPEVKLLQQFLNAQGFTVSARGAGSVGNETSYFGSATRNALIRFQKAKSITPAIGYFGPKTRGVANGN